MINNLTSLSGAQHKCATSAMMVETYRTLGRSSFTLKLTDFIVLELAIWHYSGMSFNRSAEIRSKVISLHLIIWMNDRCALRHRV